MMKKQQSSGILGRRSGQNVPKFRCISNRPFKFLVVLAFATLTICLILVNTYQLHQLVLRSRLNPSLVHLTMLSSEVNIQQDGDTVSSEVNIQQDGDAVSSEVNIQQDGDAVSSEDNIQQDGDAVSSEDNIQPDGDAVSWEDNIQQDGDVVSSEVNIQQDGDTVSYAVSSEDNIQQDGDAVSTEDNIPQDGDVVSSEDNIQQDGDVDTEPEQEGDAEPELEDEDEDEDEDSIQETLELWKQPNGENYHICVNKTKRELVNATNNVNATDGYLVTHANGGLNQMSLGISDMVAIAKTLNATLILPTLDHNSFWEDPSKFQDIYDVKNFVEVLKDDVPILESLPPGFEKRKAYERTPASFSKLSYYRDMRKHLKKRKVIRFSHSDTRLANNVAGAMQRLRCRTMYKALRFRKDIEDLGMQLVERMRARSDGPFLALHLRYEKDMLAFTGCSHGLTKAEHVDLRNMRYSVDHWKQKTIIAEEERLDGHCPMTPREVGIFLEALGYPRDTKIYLVGGEVFGRKGIKELEERFPYLFSKTVLAAEDELQPFKGFRNQMAALDYVVALHSDVFIDSYVGNMAKALQGHRMFLGFRKTISPDRKSFVRLIDKYDNGVLNKEQFYAAVKNAHEDRIGGPVPRQAAQPPKKPGKKEENFYSNPFPGCICLNKISNETLSNQTKQI